MTREFWFVIYNEFGQNQQFEMFFEAFKTKLEGTLEVQKHQRCKDVDHRTYISF